MSLLSWGGSLAASAPVVAGLVAWAVKDRRKSNAETEVAERTVDSLVGLRDTDAETARQVYMQRQADVERTFHLQQIADRDAEIARQRAELAHRDDIIARLLRDVSRLEAQLAQMGRELTALHIQLSDLSNREAPRDHPEGDHVL